MEGREGRGKEIRRETERKGAREREKMLKAEASLSQLAIKYGGALDWEQP